MNKFFQRITLVAALLLGTITVNAQKLAHFNMDSLLALMPEMKQANDDAITYYKQIEEKMSQMQAELENKYREYQDGMKKGTLTPLIQQTLENELQSLNQRIQDFQASAQLDFEQKKKSLMQPIYDKIYAAVKQIATEQKYKYVFDSSKNELSTIIFADPADNIMPVLRKKLNIPADAKPISPDIDPTKAGGTPGTGTGTPKTGGN